MSTIPLRALRPGAAALAPFADAVVERDAVAPLDVFVERDATGSPDIVAADVAAPARACCG